MRSLLSADLAHPANVPSDLQKCERCNNSATNGRSKSGIIDACDEFPHTLPRFGGAFSSAEREFACPWARFAITCPEGSWASCWHPWSPRARQGRVVGVVGQRNGHRARGTCARAAPGKPWGARVDLGGRRGAEGGAKGEPRQREARVVGSCGTCVPFVFPWPLLDVARCTAPPAALTGLRETLGSTGAWARRRRKPEG
jgi:hypothetical protein